MPKHAKPWWQLPALIATVLAGLGGISAGIVNLAAYITLPKQVEAAIQKNTEQDAILTKLGTLAEQNTAILKQITVKEVADDGEVKVLEVNGEQLCCDGRDCWPYDKKAKCKR